MCRPDSPAERSRDRQLRHPGERLRRGRFLLPRSHARTVPPGLRRARRRRHRRYPRHGDHRLDRGHLHEARRARGAPRAGSRDRPNDRRLPRGGAVPEPQAWLPGSARPREDRAGERRRRAADPRGRCRPRAAGHARPRVRSGAGDHGLPGAARRHGVGRPLRPVARRTPGGDRRRALDGHAPRERLRARPAAARQLHPAGALSPRTALDLLHPRRCAHSLLRAGQLPGRVGPRPHDHGERRDPRGEAAAGPLRLRRE